MLTHLIVFNNFYTFHCILLQQTIKIQIARHASLLVRTCCVCVCVWGGVGCVCVCVLFCFVFCFVFLFLCTLRAVERVTLLRFLFGMHPY